MTVPRRRVGIALVVLATTLLGACGGAGDLTIAGSVLILQERGFGVSGVDCFGQGQYAPIRGGAEIVVSSADGDELSTSELIPGFVTPEGNCRLFFAFNTPDGDADDLRFTINGLPGARGRANTTTPAEWQPADTDGWVTIEWP